MRNFRGNCVSAGYFALSLTGVKALRVVLYSLLIRNISKLWIFPEMSQCYLQNGTISVMRGRVDILQRHKESE